MEQDQPASGAMTAQVARLTAQVARRVSLALGVTAAAFERMLLSECSAALTAFIEQADVTRVIFYMEGRDLVATNSLPPKFKRKTVYLLKLARVPLVKEDFDKQVVFGELSEAVLDQLSALSQGIFLPLISNNNLAHGATPEVVVKNIATSMQKFVASVHVAAGQLRNQTVLPLPPVGEADLSGGTPSTEAVHLLEAALVTWTRQLRAVLMRDPESAAAEMGGAQPGPLAELDYWADRSAQLKGIWEQLARPQVQQIMRALEACRSSYLPAFARLCSEVDAARSVAAESSKLLLPLRKPLEKLHSIDDFPALASIFRPILHTLLLIWQHSKQYSSAPRLVALVRQICNGLIQQARRFCPGSELMQLESQEAAERLRLVLKVLGTFKSQYMEYKAKSVVAVPANPWRMQNGALFARLDAFLARCQDVLEFCNTGQEFDRLERVDIGGGRGRLLTNNVRSIHSEFQRAVKRFHQVEYDVLDIDEPRFTEDYAQFQRIIQDLERRLASVIIQGFDECTNVGATFKLLESFDDLVERDAINADMERKHAELVRNFLFELQEVADSFNAQKAYPVVPKNAAPHSGALAWVRGLRERITAPMDKLKGLSPAVLNSDVGLEMRRQSDNLIAAMGVFEANLMQEWCTMAAYVSKRKLCQPVLRTEPSTRGPPMLSINFDPELDKLLREVHDLLLMPSLPTDIPEPALALYERSELFRQRISTLELVAEMHNTISATILPVESGLLQQQLSDADACLRRGIETLTWNDRDLDVYLSEATQLTTGLEALLRCIKDAVAQSQGILSQWQRDTMFFERKEGRVYSFEELGAIMQEVIRSRHAAVTDGGKEIAKHLAALSRTLKANKVAPAWRDFVAYVSEIVVDGLAKSIIASLNHLHTQISAEFIARNDQAPLLEVQLELAGPDIVWSPELGDAASEAGVHGMLLSWVKSYFEIGTLMKRLDSGKGTYVKELDEDVRIREALSAVQLALLDTKERCAAFHQQFLKYSHLWQVDMQQALRTFLRSTTTAASGSSSAHGVPPTSTTGDAGAVVQQQQQQHAMGPRLEDFAAEIGKYKSIQDEVQALPSSAALGWVKVDAKPLKQAVLTWTSKWTYLYMRHLQDEVESSMQELSAFMSNANSTLDESLEEDEGLPGATLSTLSSLPSSVKATPRGPPSAEASMSSRSGSLQTEPEAAQQAACEAQRSRLYNTMACIREVQKRNDRTEAMFKPLEDTMALLSSFGERPDPELVRQLEDGPRQWRMLCKKMFSRREELAPFQTAEAIDVRRKSDAFSKKLDKYRAFFQQRAPFAVATEELSLEQVKTAYQLLDNFHNGSVEGQPSVTTLVAEAEVLRKQQDLFELYVADYIVLQRCTEELNYLKALWDQTAVVLHTFQAWSGMLWGSINVEALMEECKQLTKDIKHLPKAVRSYDVHRLLEERVKAMMLALPLVQDLHHSAMRDRHWLMLMKATGKRFVMDSNFKLGDLLKLRLDTCVDACAEIVDRAQKELLVEKALQKIEETWRNMNLTFSAYQDTDISQFSVDDAIVEMLESDNLTLQNLLGGKYVQGNPKFLEAVASWQKKLGTVDLVLNVWKDVQRKWQALEAIFIGSADIRVQLPEDSKRFHAVNADYVDLMKTAPYITNVVEACAEGRQERLDGMQQQLELCEKALQDYLETKRIAFPRFYFVAPMDLLDILSKGSNPQSVVRHLPKCFDNVHNLEFTKDAQGQPTKVAVGMYSGEGEYVQFVAPCICDGPVEVWLQSVVDSMRAALSHEFKSIIPTYDERPRAKWIFENSVQNTVVVSRLFFTQEVSEAFEELEDGSEDALKEVLERQKAQLSDLIDLINGPQSKNDRKKLITLCTVDVHARDVVQRMIEERVEGGQCFQWQSQMRYQQNDKTKECQVNICDAEIRYLYEYIGNVGCLCITPLTDRCYITLTQAQRLVLGGAPAGPAGTGKTETTKDLARALGVPCYVFNCSDQMDYKSMGQIFKGLAQTGAWACADEFNRIPVPVLSVCSTQYKCVLDALRAQKERFLFEDNEIALKPSTMMFITMNPGYPGRAELPESLKALFRPVSMAAPDLALICEIMLMSEGFQQSKLLSRKFIILYKLCEDLLSKSRHYDWKLRAIKTTLYVAGSMKRAAPELTEDKVLLRALRDFNLGKLTADDTSIFMGLLSDLFPRTLDQVPRAIDLSFESKIKEAALELGYQPDPQFCLKVSQLREIFEVRWSVFLLGPAGCGKSAIWRTLMRAQTNYGEKTTFRAINPKAVTRNELYGYLHPQTREWKDGLLSTTFRDMANNKMNRHQWIVLDGDIDAEWVESCNTVMDDNKMLTLASNERIPLTSSMRLLLEINHMNHCSPATVSRSGVIFVNADDIGWKPAVESWVEKLECIEYKPLLSMLFSKYVEPTLDHCRRNFKTVVPLSPINQVQTLMKILEGVLPKESTRGAPPPDKKLLEYHFVFACIWAFGGCLLVDKLNDYRQQFSRWWLSEHKSVVFPQEGTVFDCYVDEHIVCMVHWSQRVPKFTYTPDNFSSLFVPTVETTRLSYLLDLLVPNQHHVMFVGNSGTGKSALMRDKLRSLDPDAYMFHTINLNSKHDGPSLQPVLEAPLEKKAGMRFGPPGNRKLIYFVDDMSLPLVDKYDTQSAVELLRQSIDYHGWYDKHKILQKEVCNTQLMACLNPTAGSFHITPRMQRHFATFAVQMPQPDIIRSIYSQLVEGHLTAGGFEEDLVRMGPKLVDATIELHRLVMNHFLPSAVKFHYQFNLRELTNITQGLCRMTVESCKRPLQVVRLWVHECERVLRDRLITDADVLKFEEFKELTVRKHFADVPLADIQASPLVFNSFILHDSNEAPLYACAPSNDALKKALEEKLAEYNETNAVMDLVLFEQAMQHLSRITRILDMPRGHAMLVGVGGSGKQSLARLAAFICGCEVFQIAVTSTYGMIEFRAEDKDNFNNTVRNEVKAAGLVDTPENCWQFFIERVRKNLHVVLCFSPVGDSFRVRARQFPALVNCTVSDWFHSWPREALVSVAHRFLNDVPKMSDELRKSVAEHMAFAHQSVTAASLKYYDVFRRFNYTTPKSYLEFISLYKELLAKKRSELMQAKQRLASGVDKITWASKAVEDLQKNLEEETLIVEEKKQTTLALIESIGQEKAKVDEEVEKGREDEEAAAALQAEVIAFQDECSRNLAAAEPIIQEAEAALNSLDKSSLGELKSFGSPAAEIVQVLAACMVLCASGGNIPKDLSWNAGKKFMGNVDAFLKSLSNFDKDNIPLVCVDRVERDYISNPNFRPDYIRTKSSAAAGLCAWVINICKYFHIYQVVAPRRAALAEANKRLDGANKKLSNIRARVKELQDRVAALEENLMRATEDKNAAVAAAERTASKAALAQRLITGLASEYARWTESIEKMASTEGNLVGDVLLCSSFVTYAGTFNAELRQELTQDKWLPDIKQRNIPHSGYIDPLDMLADDSTKALWANEGLPTDPLSLENGAIVTSSARWPLLIDPHMQGIKWVKKREEPNGLRIIQQSQAKYVDTVIHCIENGLPLLIENCSEDIDPVLDPVIQKRTMKRGRALVLKIGDAEVEYDPRFRLYLQTKISNPHYRPEVAAQTTLVNFCVTEKGLEDQLLALVVDHERSDLQESAMRLVRQLAAYTISLKELEDNLLARLAASQGDILEDIPLIEGLEETKRTALEIAEKVKQAKETEVSISKAREVYRPVAQRGSLVYFMVDSLGSLDRVYHYSMANFVRIMGKAMDRTPGGQDESRVPDDKRLGGEVEVLNRVRLLVFNVTLQLFQYVSQGLFERHKLLVATQLCMRVLKRKGELSHEKYDYLLKGPQVIGPPNPVADWLPSSNWQAVLALKEISDYQALPEDLVSSSKRWKEWLEMPRPEAEPLPGDWKRMAEFDRLLLFHALRPDRLTAAMSMFVGNMLGKEYVTSQSFNLERSFADAGPDTPILVFLSPGVDVAASVEALGQKLGFTPENGKYFSVSLGQGQEAIAMRRLAHAHKNGGWVLLQNIHLTIDWTSGPLEKRIDKLADGAHPDFRLFLSAEPPPALERALPISILQASLKLTNEPPEGLKENLLRAYGNFSEEIMESCAKQSEFRSIIFALSFFHAALLERKKFGVGNLPGARSGIGWNMSYPFNTGDLLNCGQLAANHLDNSSKVPWDDLRYLFGEIMYGGHIVEDWDRRLANAYLAKFFNESLLEGIQLFPGFFLPPPTMPHPQVLEYIEDNMPAESAIAFGLAPNAEIGFKLREAAAFCNNLQALQPHEGGKEKLSVEEEARQVLEALTERIPPNFDLDDIRSRMDEPHPFNMVAKQEAERWNTLLSEMRRSLAELDLGLRGNLTMTEPMERLMHALAGDRVPESWSTMGYPSLRSLGPWMQNLLQRVAQIQDWTADLTVPKSVWLSGLFNPQSFLTAIKQTTARRNEWALDRTVLVTEVTKKTADQVDAPSRDGAYVSGLLLEGASWDDKLGILDESKPKQLFTQMPVILVKAVPAEKEPKDNLYQCPVYMTERRFREEVFTAQLKTKGPWTHWTTAGAALLLDVV
ncbi:hypothetical protein ABPG77_000992 [Micractinium sp. CCAP 211/92]